VLVSSRGFLLGVATKRFPLLSWRSKKPLLHNYRDTTVVGISAPSHRRRCRQRGTLRPPAARSFRLSQTRPASRDRTPPQATPPWSARSALRTRSPLRPSACTLLPSSSSRPRSVPRRRGTVRGPSYDEQLRPDALRPRSASRETRAARHAHAAVLPARRAPAHSGRNVRTRRAQGNRHTTRRAS